MVLRKYLLPGLAAAGVAFAAYTVAQGSRPAPAAEPVAQPSLPPYRTYVAGAGIVEASSENIAIGTPVGGIATEVLAEVGAAVAKGEPLFKLDDRDLRAELAVRGAALAAAQARLARLEGLPRPEEVPPAEARLRQAEGSLADLTQQLALWESVADKRAVSVEDLQRKRFAAQVAEARVAEARAQLALLRAGAWRYDVAVARAEVASAESMAKATEIAIERLTVRAPIDGEVLQVKLRAGEFAPAGALAMPLVLLGKVDRLHVRVDVDENDAWRFRREAQATGFVRGNRELKTALRFERVEPYVIPKRSLTGESTERVDTRVMQVLYGFDRAALPVLVGQQMDVFIEAPAVGGSAASGAEARPRG